jgi:hypothetical protein
MKNTTAVAYTNDWGMARLSVRQDELDALPDDQGGTTSAPAGKIKQVVISAARAHHGPVAPPDSVFVNGPASVETLVSIVAKGFVDGANGVVRIDASNAKSPKGLKILLVEGGTLGIRHQSIPVRALSDTAIYEELAFFHARGLIQFDVASEFDVVHDPPLTDDVSQNESANGCSDKCKIHPRKQAALTEKQREEEKTTPGKYKPWEDCITIMGKVVGVQFLQLQNVGASGTLKWLVRGNLTLVNPRHAVGLARLCLHLTRQGFAAIYTQGADGTTTRPDCHGHGMAIDFGGAARSVPPMANKSPNASQITTQRFGNDFLVLLDWGMVHMWDAESTFGVESSWERQATRDDHFDYTNQKPGQPPRLLKYRLKPAERFRVEGLKDVVDDPVRIAHLIAASELFESVYNFATREYSDRHSRLGPPADTDPPTPIDSHQPHLIFHPDYAFWNPKRMAPGITPKQTEKIKNDREAHKDHLHIQLGTT